MLLAFNNPKSVQVVTRPTNIINMKGELIQHINITLILICWDLRFDHFAFFLSPHISSTPTHTHTHTHTHTDKHTYRYIYIYICYIYIIHIYIKNICIIHRYNIQNKYIYIYINM